MRLPLPQFAATNRHPDHFAEVIETSTAEFMAQCLDPEDLNFPQMPPFGSWVSAQDEETGNQVYAVVYHASTSPVDSIHRARALGLSLQQLREQQPQIFAMLKTEFRAAIVGFRPGNQPQLIHQHLPPRPPQIHQAVYHCATAEVVAFSDRLDFLRTLIQVAGAPVDELTAAVIRQVYRARQLERTWLVQAGRALSVLLKDDYDRLSAILGQIYA
ncbi:HAS-barrel domain-containing protein [Leptolyngbya sp. FACHB-261]|uniref:HAS-barrel domain-containing protein n=1 Tax=Leptolyngbya sp. FACHB-261 TaxID=2692806 RepID=UPI001685A132|nr:HAS-barrel domain-containing protein [Leptolyngbya sp. FACHB-261]MBD2104778.1 hypothetical protein [Leptolyngbya sp. FACHB-261]